jgi:hypothetical protein
MIRWSLDKPEEFDLQKAAFENDRINFDRRGKEELPEELRLVWQSPDGETREVSSRLDRDIAPARRLVFVSPLLLVFAVVLFGLVPDHRGDQLIPTMAAAAWVFLVACATKRASLELELDYETRIENRIAKAKLEAANPEELFAGALVAFHAIRDTSPRLTRGVFAKTFPFNSGREANEPRRLLLAAFLKAAKAAWEKADDLKAFRNGESNQAQTQRATMAFNLYNEAMESAQGFLPKLKKLWFRGTTWQTSLMTSLLWFSLFGLIAGLYILISGERLELK